MKTKDIRFLEVRYLRGPNIWTYRPVIEAIVDIGELEDYPSHTLPGFVDRLQNFLPSMIEHRCSYGERGGFFKRLEEGTWVGHILEHVTLELQNLAGMPGGFGKARETPERGIYKVVIRAWDEEVTRACLAAGRELILAAIKDEPFDITATIERLSEIAEDRLLGPSTSCIIEAANAKDRMIPAIRMLSTGNLVQLGYGAKSRRIWTAETDRTSAIAETISCDKDLTKSLLQFCGVPTPEGKAVQSAEEAWEAAKEIGLPVVVKPCDGNHARGVFIDLTTQEEIMSAYEMALEEGNSVMVEKFIRGTEHRLLVVGNKMVAASGAETASVIGDGKSTLNELIDQQINSDPRRGANEEFPLDVIILTENPVLLHEVKKQGFNPDSIIPEGHKVLVQNTGNHTTDITDLVHPDTAEKAALAARIVGLDIAGVDLVCEDISQPLAAQQGAIIEVNAGPGLLMHLKPANGEPRPVGQAIIDHLFPDGEKGRIPIVGVTGSYGKTTVSKLIAHLITLAGKYTGLACSHGTYLDRRKTTQGDCANWEAAHRVLINRAVEAAVFENGSDSILADGLAYDRCQIGVITNCETSCHTGRFYIESPEHVFNVLRTQIDVILPEGAAILNARYPMLVDMATLCDGEVIYFSIDPSLPVIAEHLQQGKRAIITRYGQIIMVSEHTEVPLTGLADIPLLKDPTDQDETENILTAVAAAWALGIAPKIIKTGIETYFAS